MCIRDSHWEVYQTVSLPIETLGFGINRRGLSNREWDARLRSDLFFWKAFWILTFSSSNSPCRGGCAQPTANDTSGPINQGQGLPQKVEPRPGHGDSWLLLCAPRRCIQTDLQLRSALAFVLLSSPWPSWPPRPLRAP